MKNDRINSIKSRFLSLYGESVEQIRCFASPGRVNLIGEHIDYCGGFVFPAALTLDNIVAIRINGTNKLNMSATDLNDIYTADLDNIDEAKKLKWGNYQSGVAKELINYGINVKGVDMLFDGTVPYGSGLSSSASIELVTGLALSSLFAKGIPSLVELAIIGKNAENNFCGVNCGIMDQFASAMGKEDKAILLNCNTLEYEYVPLQLGDYVLILANTNVKHSLGVSKYNERRNEVDIGLRILQNADKDNIKNNLCDYALNDFNKHIDSFTDPVIKNRVLHVISENERVLKAVSLLRAGKLLEFGSVLCEANDSIRYLYEVTGLELDTMYDIAIKQEGCIGARMTGAGFGGCTINIVRNDCVNSFIEGVGKDYRDITGIEPNFYVCKTGDGAREIF